MNNSDLEEIRSLLLNLSSDELTRLKSWVNNPDQFARELGKILPQAVGYAANESDKLSFTLTPMIEEMITHSIAENPDLLATALFPIIGRTIRKSINEEFRKLLNTFNELIKNTFSWRSFKWRYQALITGQKYSEVVISNTIKYKAENVFLIHKETGLLLCEVHDKLSKTSDTDMISGMLKAIMDFVQDSFESSSDKQLNTIEIEDSQLIIEQGPHAIIASMVKGYTLDEYRNIIWESLAKIHDEYGAALANFDGNTMLFEPVKSILYKCLVTEKKEMFEAKRSRIGLLIAVPLALVLLFFGIRFFYYKRQWHNYIKVVKEAPGILLSQYGTSNDAYFIRGLMFPGALHPDSILANFNFKKEGFVSEWNLYFPEDASTLLAYVDNNFSIQPDAKLTFDNSNLLVSGRFTNNWLNKLQAFVDQQLPGVQLQSDDFEIISEASIQKQIDTIRQIPLRFTLGGYELDSTSLKNLHRVSNLLHSIDHNAALLHKKIEIDVTGYTDEIGTEDFNLALSLKRAASVVALLKEDGNIDKEFSAKGGGICNESDVNSINDKRKVTVTVHLD